MNTKLLDKLTYSYEDEQENYSFPLPLKDSLQLIFDYFSNNSTNKLCLVFPSKEFAAQWLSIPTVLFLIENDFKELKGEIFESYRQYKPGDKLILNNLAIVEWLGVKQNGVAFKTKGIKESSGAEITIRFSDVIMLQKAPASRKALSSLKSVKEALPSRNITPTEKLLNIDTFGNQEFIKNTVCLVTKYKAFEDSIDSLVMNFATLPEYFQAGRIDENGTADMNSPLLLSNNLSNVYLYLANASNISKIIIDGFYLINERGISDFADIETLNLNIPTILITDLAEMESFETIGQFGFEFFNFTKENIHLDHQSVNSPFHAFNNKLNKYIHFDLVKEICQDSNLETITQKIYSIEKDDSNQNLNTLKINLIQLTNFISRICHVPNTDEISFLNQKITTIDSLFQRNRMWLGDSHKPIDESITLLRSVIEKLSSEPSEKCSRLEVLMNKQTYDYIICATEDEAQALKNFLSAYTQTQIISVADVNDSLLTNKSVKAIVTGWAKSNNINRILSSFLFSELTVLFYEFENKYYNSLQRRNRKYNENIKSTINNKGSRSGNDFTKLKGFDHLYSDDGVPATTSESPFDILEFELKLDNAQYSRYKAKGNLIESIKAKRIDFENNLFIYANESHRFLVINELVLSAKGEKGNIHRKKIEAIVSGDVIVQINTDRDILADLVEKNTSTQDLAAVKQWTGLWRNLLKEHFASIGNNFKRLVDELRQHGCKKHEVTIRTWLQDENRIGPDDDSDLISIALMTDSKLLYNSISKVREAIRKMTGWRMKASDFITERIKAQIHEFADTSIINKKISIEGLGSVFVLKAIEVSNAWENVDVRYVNRLLKKELV